MKNRNLMSGIAERIEQGQEGAGPGSAGNERSGPFGTNIAGITNPRAPGQPNATIQKATIQRLHWVDPARCRLWQHHNRAYELLNAERCADLIAGFRTLGRQERPAIVRSLKGDARAGADGAEHDFEILSGGRRHWTVSWLRMHGEVNAEGEPYLLLIQVRDELDTAAAFELSDAENRGQRDISDFERAREYRWALKSLYEGNISRMADAIQIDRSNLSRILALCDMPDDLVRAYPSILEIRTSHWRQLSPIFSSEEPAHRDAVKRILACGRALAKARSEHSSNLPQTGAETLAAFLDAARDRRTDGRRSIVLSTVSAKATGKLAVRIKRTSRGMTLELPRASGATKQELYAAMQQAVDDYFEE
ncbi:ParB/RepB/Spo0J family partition protein [Thiocapsa roseopersicina]|uniref:Chromosome partitioning protein, ParB family n=1 Tax=Thiocapsa roseopersicina TaxID=1058 RepID=A0A1H3CME5_THIRO|nr:ParB N-terminal domain-containing protein [Thiocapsa roseopersicina]SDX54764.1 chromosome partitioning protein, ParB family [Thiocapsa roseopersicina]